MFEKQKAQFDEKIRPVPPRKEDTKEGPEDIFAETEAPVEKIKPELPQAVAEPDLGISPRKKIWLIVLVVVLSTSGLAAGWLYWNFRFRAESYKEEVEKEKEIEKPVEIELPEEEAIIEVDTDGDGLSDKEEERLGTSSLKTDTDEDGLFDREEVKVWQTDPLDPDTDGDGYPDGLEVKSGYNPKGEGKWKEI